MTRVAWIVAIWLLMATAAHAQPTISGVSGTIAHGEAVVVTGSGFGTKPAQTPFRWDDLNGTDGTSMSTDARGWIVSSNSPVPELTNAVTRSTPGRTTSMMLGQTGASVPAFGFGDNNGDYLSLTASSSGNTTAPPAGALLIDYWMRFDEGGTANNYKFARWHSADNPSSGSGNKIWSMPAGNGATEGNAWGYSNQIGVTTIGGGSFHHVRWLLHWSDTQAENYLNLSVDNRVYMDSDGAGNYVSPDPGQSEGAYDPLPSGDRLSTWIIEMQNDTAGSGARDAKQYVQDFFVDSGYNRFEIGNHATYTSATQLEIQPYTAWASGEVTLTINRGGFGPTDSAWLFACDATNACSAGTAITFGDEGGGETPSTPIRLRIRGADAPQ